MIPISSHLGSIGSGPSPSLGLSRRQIPLLLLVVLFGSSRFGGRFSKDFSTSLPPFSSGFEGMMTMMMEQRQDPDVSAGCQCLLSKKIKESTSRWRQQQTTDIQAVEQQYNRQNTAVETSTSVTLVELNFPSFLLLEKCSFNYMCVCVCACVWGKRQ